MRAHAARTRRLGPRLAFLMAVSSISTTSPAVLVPRTRAAVDGLPNPNVSTMLRTSFSCICHGISAWRTYSHFTNASTMNSLRDITVDMNQPTFFFLRRLGKDMDVDSSSCSRCGSYPRRRHRSYPDLCLECVCRTIIRNSVISEGIITWNWNQWVDPSDVDEAEQRWDQTHEQPFRSCYVCGLPATLKLVSGFRGYFANVCSPECFNEYSCMNRCITEPL